MPAMETNNANLPPSFYLFFVDLVVVCGLGLMDLYYKLAIAAGVYVHVVGALKDFAVDRLRLALEATVARLLVAILAAPAVLVRALQLTRVAALRLLQRCAAALARAGHLLATSALCLARTVVATGPLVLYIAVGLLGQSAWCLTLYVLHVVLASGAVRYLAEVASAASAVAATLVFSGAMSIPLTDAEGHVKWRLFQLNVGLSFTITDSPSPAKAADTVPRLGQDIAAKSAVLELDDAAGHATPTPATVPATPATTTTTALATATSITQALVVFVPAMPLLLLPALAVDVAQAPHSDTDSASNDSTTDEESETDSIDAKLDVEVGIHMIEFPVTFPSSTEPESEMEPEVDDAVDAQHVGFLIQPLEDEEGDVVDDAADAQLIDHSLLRREEIDEEVDTSALQEEQERVEQEEADEDADQDPETDEVPAAAVVALVEDPVATVPQAPELEPESTPETLLPRLHPTWVLPTPSPVTTSRKPRPQPQPHRVQRVAPRPVVPQPRRVNVPANYNKNQQARFSDFENSARWQAQRAVAKARREAIERSKSSRF